MPFSFVQYPGNGSTVSFAVPFPYLLRSHVRLYYGLNFISGGYTQLLVDGTDYNWNTGGTQITLASPPGSGALLTIRRETPTANRLVDFADGSNLIEQNLDTAGLQTYYVVQELYDYIEQLSISPGGNVPDGAVTEPKLASNAVTTLKLIDGVLSANPAGRAKMADGFLSADADGLAKMADGYLSANAAGRAKMADLFITTLKLANGVLSADADGLAKMADGYLSADAAGRAKMADLFITTAKLADAQVTPAKLSQPLTLATSVASTSGTRIDFTGIPSWVKRLTVMFNGVSTNGSSQVLVQIGGGSITSSGYQSSAFIANGSTAYSSWVFTAGFGLAMNSPLDARSGLLTIANLSGNVWVSSHSLGNGANSNNNALSTGGGTVTLSGTLDRVRITTVNGTDAFDAGSINILYE